ncbi:MAG: hypothetical protein LBI42_06800 [Chitinispirillales bacterium]|jgi:5-methylcytosine-specific restriction protein A|nr:hypothetical protein [Chitinispirillales bacterium]
MRIIDRNSIDDARRIIENFIPDDEARTALLEFLASAIVYANSINAKNWNLSLCKTGLYVRLNIGQKYSIQLEKKHIRILCFKDDIKSIFTHPIDGIKFGIGKNHGKNQVDYLTAPVNVIAVIIKQNKIVEYLKLLKQANDKYISIGIQKTRIRPQSKTAHSPGCIKYFSKILNKEIPNPSYVANRLKSKNLLDDDFAEQEKIQQAKSATAKEIKNSANRSLSLGSGSQGETVSKNSNISKAAIEKANYTCLIDPNHNTFINTQSKPYMEGHHLIPCTVTNAKIFFDKYKKNIDCFENIVCICPTCHRAVHFGHENTKIEKIKIMYAKQAGKLENAGIPITEQELLELY